jgi:methyl-accepting chemotaxis protein
VIAAEAAKEIKALIVESGKKVENGTWLVGASGKGLEEIVTAVKKVNGLMVQALSIRTFPATNLADSTRPFPPQRRCSDQNSEGW